MRVYFFEFLKIVCEFYVMLVNVDMCESVFITSDYASSLQLFLLNFDVKYYCFEMHAYVWWRIRGTINREENFFKTEKIALIMAKHAQIVFIYGLNADCVVDEIFTKMPLV